MLPINKIALALPFSMSLLLSIANGKWNIEFLLTQGKIRQNETYDTAASFKVNEKRVNEGVSSHFEN